MINTPDGMFISVIIPCYNEAGNIVAGKLDEVYAYLQQQAFDWEMIIVDDGSTDNSRDQIRDFNRDKPAVSLIEIQHFGKPFAVRAGVEEACGDAVLLIDLDQSSPIAELDNLLPWYLNGFNVVIGARRSTRMKRSLFRLIGSTIFRTLRRIVILHDIVDTQCGFKLCSRKRLLAVLPRLQYFRQAKKAEGWKVSAYDVELLFLLKQAGCRIKEVEIDWSNRDQSDTKYPAGESAKYFRESVEMAVEVVRVKVNWVRGVYR